MESVALVTREAGAHEAAQRVGAVRKDVTGPVLALVLIWAGATGGVGGLVGGGRKQADTRKRLLIISLRADPVHQI